MMAFLTSHVVTSVIFPGFDFAFWTGLDVRIVPCPSIKIIVTHVRTPDPSVSCRTTPHAYFLPTLTPRGSMEDASRSNVFHTAIPRAPSKTWVQINVNLQLKSDILLE
jgi:hypothetical protein